MDHSPAALYTNPRADLIASFFRRLDETILNGKIRTVARAGRFPDIRQPAQRS